MVTPMTSVNPTKHAPARLAAAIASLGLLTGAAIGVGSAPGAMAAEPEAAAAAEVYVFASCNPDGSTAWTATGSGFKPGTQWFMTSVSTWNYVGGGSDSNSEGHGTVTSSSGGFVNTST